MKLDLTSKYINLDGSPSVNSIGKDLAPHIGAQLKGNLLKLYGWYKDLSDDKPLTLSVEDQKDLKDIIITSENMYVFFRGQLLELLDKK